MHPTYKKIDEFQGEKQQERPFIGLWKQRRFTGAIRKGETNRRPWRRLKTGAMQICTLCGYTVEGEAPERCPICGA